MAGSPTSVNRLMLDTTENAVHGYSIERREGEASGADFDVLNALTVCDGGA